MVDEQMKLGEDKIARRKQDFENVLNNQGGYGRLKFVSRARNPFKCRECKMDVESGNAYYSQSDYTGEGTFPVQTKLCLVCAQTQINKGVGIKEVKKKVKTID